MKIHFIPYIPVTKKPWPKPVQFTRKEIYWIISINIFFAGVMFVLVALSGMNWFTP